MKAMILAAGLGTRLRPYSEYRPKPLFPVLGKPLLLHHLKQLRNSGFSKLVVNAHFLSGQFPIVLHGESDVRLQFEDDILGTGGGVRKAISLLGKNAPLLVVNGDILHSLNPAEIYSSHLSSGLPVSLVVHDLPRFNNLLVSADGRVTGLRVEKGAVNHEEGERFLAFAGIHVIDPGVVKNIPSSGFFDIIDLYQRMLDSGLEINAISVAGHFWSDIGTPADYLCLHKELLTDPALIDKIGLDVKVDRPVHFEKDVVMGRNVEIEEWAFVGSGAVIGNGARIARSVVWDGARVADCAVIEDEIVPG